MMSVRLRQVTDAAMCPDPPQRTGPAGARLLQQLTVGGLLDALARLPGASGQEPVLPLMPIMPTDHDGRSDEGDDVNALDLGFRWRIDGEPRVEPSPFPPRRSEQGGESG